MTEPKIKPTAFKPGVPKSQKNGLYGMEKTLMEKPGEPVFAIVQYGVDDIVHHELENERQVIVGVTHIEPITDEFALGELKATMQETYKKRTGELQLNFDEIEEPKADKKKAFPKKDAAE